MITLFDIPSTLPGNAWSLNSWRVRLALAYKGIPFRTEWIEYPEIQPALQKHNIGPTDTNSDGSPYYSIPAILDVDDTTGKVKAALADSFPIAKYLDDAYPDTPRLVPEGAYEDQKAFADGFMMNSIAPIMVLMIRLTLPKLHDASQNHFACARARDFYTLFKVESVEDWPWAPEDQAKLWGDAKAVLDKLDAKVSETDGKGPWYLGDQVSFADFVLGGCFIWMQLVLGEDSEEWANAKSWNGGRWGRYLQNVSQWRETGLKY